MICIVLLLFYILCVNVLFYSRKWFLLSWYLCLLIFSMVVGVLFVCVGIDSMRYLCRML